MCSAQVCSLHLQTWKESSAFLFSCILRPRRKSCRSSLDGCILIHKQDCYKLPEETPVWPESRGGCFPLAWGAQPALPASVWKSAETVVTANTIAPSPLTSQALSVEGTKHQPLFLCSDFLTIPPLGSILRQVRCLWAPLQKNSPSRACAHPQPCAHAAPSHCREPPALSHPSPKGSFFLLHPTNRTLGMESPVARTLLFSLDHCWAPQCHSLGGWKNSFPFFKMISRTWVTM